MGYCLDAIMSQVSEDLQKNPMAILVVTQLCEENDNDPKKVADILTHHK